MQQPQGQQNQNKNQKKPCNFGAQCKKKQTCQFFHPGDDQNIDVSTQPPCNSWHNNFFCNKVHCKYAHVIPGTQDQNTNTYIVVNKSEQVNLKMKTSQGEKVLSASKALINGNESIIAVSSLQNLYITDL